jgi:hypothetical protein
MKVSGYWEFNQEMLVGLNMWDYYQTQLAKYSNKPDAAMTSAMLHIL